MPTIIRIWLSVPIGTSTILPESEVTIGFRALQQMGQLIHLDDLSILAYRTRSPSPSWPFRRVSYH
jgi:hypothetical protein